MASEQEITEALRAKLEQNLTEVQYRGPQRLIGGELIDMLLELALGVLEQCLGSFGTARESLGKKLGPFKRMKLKSKLVGELYQGKRKTFDSLEGDKVLSALVNAIETTTPDEATELVDYVEREARAWIPTDYKWT